MRICFHCPLSLQLDLLISFGNPMLRYCEQRLVPHHSCLLALLMAASLGRTPAIRAWAEEALRWVHAGSQSMLCCAMPVPSRCSTAQTGQGALQLFPFAASGGAFHALLAAALLAASLQLPPALLCSWMALRMHQGRVISLLEPYLEHELAPVRQKAAQHLMVAT